MTITELTVLTVTAGLVSLALIWILGVLPERRRAHAEPARPNDCHFLFRGDRLVDHDAGDSFPASVTDSAAWTGFRDWLGFRFPDLPESPNVISPGETRHFHSWLPQDNAHIEARATPGALRVRLCEDQPPSAAGLNEIRRAHHASGASRQALRVAPYPVWMSDDAGVMVWENSAAAALSDADKARMSAELMPPPTPPKTKTRRIRVPDGDVQTPDKWFDVTVRCREDGRLFFANDVSGLVAAETTQREFVQTLGKTFADLPTGLAVFDRAKTLVMFNPSLIDLTGLQVEFLSARPDIVAFFDMLRDRQVMPEPKNYSSWRSQINDMVSAAHDGHYREMWSLANGQSYRVTGRPHPDGAVAFLFEDISHEMSRTRHHRGEMALRDSLLDHLDAAVAVLSQDRRVIFCNRAFGDIIDMTPDTPITELCLSDVMQACQARFPDRMLWSEVENRITSNALRNTLTDSIAPDGAGTRVDLKLTPLGQGRAMLSLHQQAQQSALREPERIA
ncbi:PAS-domain containing protein [Roseovarius tibetensis]|uniref:PAS-domain containing protein n=1 Tax=Roseovarius tibetensis TaxID=2685897 RepID=UPI003D7FF4DB